MARISQGWNNVTCPYCYPISKRVREFNQNRKDDQIIKKENEDR